MIPAAELKVRVAIEGIPQGNAKLQAFEGNLKRVSGYNAEATLRANVEGRGFEEFDARTSEIRRQAMRPIEQDVRADVDEASFVAAQAQMKALKAEAGGSGIYTPWWLNPGVIAAASPPVLQLSGALTALAGSFTEAALGAGALAIGGYGTGSVGIGGIIGVAVPAVKSLAELKKAQDAYTEAIATYGKNSTQAETAAKKVRAAARAAGPEAQNVAKALSHVGDEWMDLTKAGRGDFLGALGDGLDHLDRKLPVLARSANRSTSAMRRDFNSFLEEVTGRGSGFNRFIERMTDNFDGAGPDISHALADWVKIFERIAIAVSPDMLRGLDTFSDWSDDMLASTGNARELRRDVHGLVEQTGDWFDLLVSGGDFLLTLFGEGAGEGQHMVKGMTGTFDDWTRSIEENRGEVREFFGDAREGTEHLLSTTAGLAEQWFVVAQALEPVEHIVLDITEALNSVKIGDFSLLTLLLTGGFVAGTAGKALAIYEVVKGYKALRIALAGQAGLTSAVAAASGRAATAASAEAAANTRLAGSLRAVSAARGPLLVANASGAVVGTADDVAGAGVGGGSAGKNLGSRLLVGAGTWGLGGLLVGQLTDELVSGSAGDRLSTALEGAGFGAAIGSAIAPGIGTAVGAAIGAGITSFFADDHDEWGDQLAANYLSGLRRRLPEIRRMVHTADLGSVGRTERGSADVFGVEVPYGESVGRRGLRGVRAEMREELRYLTGQGASDQATAALKRELSAVESAIAKIAGARRAFHDSMVELSADAVVGMKAINHDLSRGLDQASAAWETGTQPWRKHTAEAMERAIQAIRTGMELGTIPVEQGQRRINRLLGQIHLTRGDDPFGLAEATAKTFKQANGITADGVNDWVRKLDRLPKAARNKTIDATMGMLRAWAEGHPKIERQIDALTRYQILKFGATNKQLREGVRRGATGPIADAYREMAGGSAQALENLGINTNRLLKALGAEDMVQFKALVLTGGKGSLPKFGGGEYGAKGQNANPKDYGYQSGGIIPGVTEGDSVERAVRPRTFILNREATRAFGFNEGGLVPVVLEPGEREFTPEEVDRIGLDTLMWMNSAVPRFASGGEVAGQVSGPGAIAALGHGALRLGFGAAQKRIDKQRAKVKHSAGAVPGYSGPPANMKQLGDAGWVDGHTLAVAAYLERRFGISRSSGFRDPSHNAAVGGVSGSLHTHGSPSNPGALDFTPPSSAALAFSQSHIAGLEEAMIHDAGSGLHLHLGFFQGGGPVLALQSGGSVGNINHVFPGATLGGEGDWTNLQQLPDYVIAALAEAAGDWHGNNVPGVTMMKVQKHEGVNRPGSMSTDAGYGLWAMTKPYADQIVANFGGYGQMLNPVKNAAAMAMMYEERHRQSRDALIGTWHGAEFYVDGLDEHYSGNFDIRNALGGVTFAEALAGKTGSDKPVPEQVEGKYTKHKKGSTSRGGGTYGEDVHARYRVQTDLLSFGGLPDTVKGCTKELNLRRRQLGEYRAAARQTKDPDTRHDLEANAKGLERRIDALRKQRARLIQQERVKRAVKKINEAAEFKAWTARGGLFDQREEAFGELDERAGDKVSLEPEPPQTMSADWANTVLKPYVEGVETPAYGAVLQAAADWRNTIIGAENFAQKKIEDWNAQIENLRKNIEEIQALKANHPQAWMKRKGEIPGMRAKIKALHANIATTRDTTLPEWESTLGGVQGLGRTHELLPGLPAEPSEQFGGDVFRTQMTIRELGLKVPNALAGVTQDDQTERLELELELERQANRRHNVETALAPVLQQFESTYPMPYMGAFAQGGVALVGERGPELAHFPSGTRVHTATDTERMLSGAGQLRVIVNGSIRQEPGDTRDPIEVLQGDRRFDALIEEKMDTFRGSVPTAGGGSWRP